MLVILEPAVEDKVHSFFDSFRAFLKTDEAVSGVEERRARRVQFETILGQNRIDKLTEIELGQILQGLWANAGWTNKTYVADRVLKSNDLSTLKAQLYDLFWGKSPLPNRFDKFSASINGLGPAGMTEILAFVHPEECGLWNERTREALNMLGLGKALPTNKYHITGDEYVRFNQVLRAIAESMEKAGFGHLDLLNVDFFLYFIETNTTLAPTTGPESEEYDFDHEEIVDKLLEVGNGLGFNAQPEYLIAKGARVDALWTAKIANLGMINYVFEVQKGGSVDSLILNLQRARNNPTVQKLVVVANGEVIKDIMDEVASLSEDFRKSLAFIEAKNILRAAALLKDFNSILEKLELVRLEF